MADKDDAAPAPAPEPDVEGDTLSAEDLAYLDSGGVDPAPKAEAKAEPEPEAEAEGEPAPAGKAKTVPHQALHAEREANKALKAELTQLREQQAQIVAAIQQARQAQQKPEEQDPEPDPQKDIFGHVAWQRRQMARVMQYLSAREQQTAQQQRQQEEAQRTQQLYSALDAQYVKDRDAYVAKDPTFGAAADYLVQAYDRVLAQEGYNPQARQQIMMERLRKITLDAYKAGRNAAEDVVAWAKTYGYQPQPQADPGERVEQLNKARGAAKSLSGVGGKAKAVPSIDDLLADDETAAAFMDSVDANPDKLRRAMGIH